MCSRGLGFLRNSLDLQKVPPPDCPQVIVLEGWLTVCWPAHFHKHGRTSCHPSSFCQSLSSRSRLYRSSADAPWDSYRLGLITEFFMVLLLIFLLFPLPHMGQLLHDLVIQPHLGQHFFQRTSSGEFHAARHWNRRSVSRGEWGRREEEDSHFFQLVTFVVCALCGFDVVHLFFFCVNFLWAESDLCVWDCLPGCPSLPLFVHVCVSVCHHWEHIQYSLPPLYHALMGNEIRKNKNINLQCKCISNIVSEKNILHGMVLRTITSSPLSC